MLRLVNRVFVVNRNSKHKLDGIVGIKLLIALIENLKGAID